MHYNHSFNFPKCFLNQTGSHGHVNPDRLISTYSQDTVIPTDYFN